VCCTHEREIVILKTAWVSAVWIFWCEGGGFYYCYVSLETVHPAAVLALFWLYLDYTRIIFELSARVPHIPYSSLSEEDGCTQTAIRNR